MLDGAAIAAVSRHGALHELGMCSCPCFDALVGLAQAVLRGEIVIEEVHHGQSPASPAGNERVETMEGGNV